MAGQALDETWRKMCFLQSQESSLPEPSPPVLPQAEVKALPEDAGDKIQVRRKRTIPRSPSNFELELKLKLGSSDTTQ